MKKLAFIHITLALTICITFNSIAQDSIVDKRITISDIPVSIIPPKYFEYDSPTKKICHPGSMTTIQVKEAKGQNFKKITAAMTKKHFESQGFTFLSKEETQMQDGNDAVIFRCKFSSHDNNGNEMTFIRLMLFTGKENTIWATADFPECISTQIEEPIKNSLTSISQ